MIIIYTGIFLIGHINFVLSYFKFIFLDMGFNISIYFTFTEDVEERERLDPAMVMGSSLLRGGITILKF